MILDSGTWRPPFMQNRSKRDPDTIVSLNSSPSDRTCEGEPRALHTQAWPSTSRPEKHLEVVHAADDARLDHA
jgi:hypothetical protein